MSCISSFFFFNDTATTEIYTLSLHDALPISMSALLNYDYPGNAAELENIMRHLVNLSPGSRDRKSTRLNSSHQIISYAVFCLKKKRAYLVDTVTYPESCSLLAHAKDT